MAYEVTLHSQRLLELAANGHSGVEMEEITGVPAAHALMQVQAMIRDRDIWSEEERKALLLHSLYKFKETLEENMDWSDPKVLRLYLQTLTQVGDRLDKAISVSQAQLERVTEVHARKLLGLYEAATNRAKDILSEAYPSETLDDIDLALRQALSETAVGYRG